MQLVFDGHNDVLLRLWRNAEAGGDPIAEMVNGTTAGHIDLPRAKAGGLAGGLCAIYIPNTAPLTLNAPNPRGEYANRLSPPLDRQPSLDIAIAKAAIALKLERAGVWKLCRSTDDIRAAMTSGVFAAVLHMEGCEASARTSRRWKCSTAQVCAVSGRSGAETTLSDTACLSPIPPTPMRVPA